MQYWLYPAGLQAHHLGLSVPLDRSYYLQLYWKTLPVDWDVDPSTALKEYQRFLCLFLSSRAFSLLLWYVCLVWKATHGGGRRLHGATHMVFTLATP